ncbi:MAG: efflux RND transporter permease subunit [Gammaproteobacteria bacterium]|nr:efflux RND transporter permease subunit [Gammaproteobacteria bacterium]
MRLIRFSINNPLLTNLLLALILIAGVLSWYAMPQEMFPVVELDRVRIATVFEGASPEEVERLVTLPIEQEFDGMADIDDVISTSGEGASNIVIKLKSGSDVDDFLRDARAALDRITDLPELAEEPQLARAVARFPVISVALYGDVSQAYLVATADDVKRRLLELPGVASANISGDRDWEMWVTVDPQRMAALRVSLSEVIQALRENLTDLPGGSIEAQEGDILLRGKGAQAEPEVISQLVLRSSATHGELHIGAVADVERRLDEPKTLGRFNGRPSANIVVTKTTDSSTIDIAHNVREMIAALSATLPPAVNAGVYSDLSSYVNTRLNTVKSSGLIGLALVLLSLYLFLNFRVALITALGIPVSFLFALILVNYYGHTINMVSLFAFLIALGMIVDDAIIVTENIYRHMEAGMEPTAAAHQGAREVFWPVIASTATTIAAFMPMFSIGGTMGAFIAVIPVVVTACLIGSLWEAFGVLPSHAKELLRVRKDRRSSRLPWGKLLNGYSAVLRWSLLNRYLVGTATVGALLIVITFAATRMPFQLFGHIDVGQFFINAEAPNTYSLDDSARLAARMEREISALLDSDTELDTLLTNVGVTFIDFNTVKFDSNYIQLVVDLKKRKAQGFIERWITPLVSLKFSAEGVRERSTTEIIDLLRGRLSTMTGVRRLSILRPQGGPAGSDIEVGVTGPDVTVLRQTADRVRGYLLQLAGVHDVVQDLEAGKLEYIYTLNERGRQLGLTQQQLSEAVRSGFQGLEVVHVNWQEKRIPVRLVYPDAWRKRSAMLEELRVTLPSGKSVYLGDVADVVLGRGFNTVKRRNGMRLATVSAEVDDSVATPLEVVDLIKAEFAEFETQQPGYRLLFLGEKRDATKSMKDMISALIIALAIIFFILAALFKSLLDPLVVMFAIPFGAIGVVFGHLLLGYHLQFLSMVGFLALAGIVVNDSLILIDFAKRLHEQGMDLSDAMLEAGRVRARPILLTSVTTFLGISPLIFFSTGQTAFLAPMAVSLGFGLLFATVLILVALPCFYLMANDLRTLTVSRLKRLHQPHRQRIRL